MMKTIGALLALASVMNVAVAAEAVVLKDTRTGAAGFSEGAYASGELLTRLGDLCTLSVYRKTQDKVPMPVVDNREYRCDLKGNRI